MPTPSARWLEIPKAIRDGVIPAFLLLLQWSTVIASSGAKPAVLLAVSGQFATYGDALLTAQPTARDLEVHSFTIDWPGGTSDHYFRDGDGWRLK